MALATNSTPGSIILGGDLTGTAAVPELRITGVTAGTYAFPTVVVDTKGRLIYAVTAASTNFGGDLSGILTSNSLIPTTVAAGTYTNANITVDSTGRVTAASTSSIGTQSSYTTSGIASIQQTTGLTIAAGVVSGTSASTAVLGVATTANQGNITISLGALDVGTNIPKLDTVNTHTKTMYLSSSSPASGSVTPDLSSYEVYFLNLASGSYTINLPANAVDNQIFTIVTTNAGSMSITTSAITSNEWRAMAWSGSVFCAVAGITAHSNTNATSTDGVSWTTHTVPNISWLDILWYNTMFIAVGVGGTTPGNAYCYTSPDGVSWTSRTVPTSNSYDKIVRCGSLLVAIGSVFSGLTLTGYSTMYSTDGINWTAGASFPSTLSYFSLVSDNSTIYLIPNDATYYTTTDGYNWTTRTKPVGGGGYSVFNGTTIASFGREGGTVVSIVYSTDGINWSSGTTNLPGTSIGITSVFWSSGQYFMNLSNSGAGYATYYTSSDLVNWTGRTTLAEVRYATVNAGTYAVMLSSTHSFQVNATYLNFASGYKFSNTAVANGTNPTILQCVYHNSTVYGTYLK